MDISEASKQAQQDSSLFIKKSQPLMVDERWLRYVLYVLGAGLTLIGLWLFL